jgi:hypothetical protein
MPIRSVAVPVAAVADVRPMALGVECLLAMTPDGELRVQHRGDEQQGENRTHTTNLLHHYRLVKMAWSRVRLWKPQNSWHPRNSQTAARRANPARGKHVGKST